MLELQSYSTLEVSQPFVGNEISVIVLGRRSDYSKGFSWGPRPKSQHAASSSSSTSHEREMHVREVIKLKAHLQEVEEESNQRHEESARQIEEMKNMIEELTRATRSGP